MKHKVYIHFPKTGLGNLLLVWSRARIFSEINALPLVASSWWGIRWGSWLRNEKHKRVYWGYFRESRWIDRLNVKLCQQLYETVAEPPVARQSLPKAPTVYCFRNAATQEDLFLDIRPHRIFIRSEIHKLLKPALLQQWQTLPAPEIAVHIRRGDFRHGNPVTPVNYFVQAIEFIRSCTGKTLPVTVFTDAEEEEITDVLQLENTKLAERKPDILDILQMSQSRVLVLSQSSTFSYWAAFLSDAIVIKPHGDWQNDLRPQEVNETRFEGKVSFSQPGTLESLRKALQKETW